MASLLRPRGSDSLLRDGQDSRGGLPPIVRANRAALLPLSFAQQRLWLSAQRMGVRKTHHVPLSVRLSGDLDSGALRRALDRLVARHEALRTTFVCKDGQPSQRIGDEGTGFALKDDDLRGRGDAERELQRLAIEESETAFDLEAGPLARGRLIRLAEREHALLITLHRIVSDEWSMGVLKRELCALYGAFREAAGDPLPELAIQYPDYAVWQRSWLSAERVQAQSDYWRGVLADAPPVMELPSDRGRPARQGDAGAFVALELDETLTAGLKALSRRRGTILFMTLTAGWAALLSRLSGQEDVVIGAPVANRRRIETEPLIGLFANRLALRLDLSGGLPVGELLERVKIKVLEAQQHQDLPFEQVAEIARPPRSPAHEPLFRVMFAWRDEEDARLDLSGLTVESLPTPYAFAKFDLTLSLSEARGRIVGGVEYDAALFDQATVERYGGYLRSLLEGMAADDERPVDRLPLLGEDERHRLLVEWNATDSAYPQDKCVHELFEAQAARTPDATAIAYEDLQLTYAELNSWANRLAHRLWSLRVGPDKRVAICVERSPVMVVGLLGVLKAGGAYVPLDPAYPAERLAYMLEDSAPVVVLSHSPARAALDRAMAGLTVRPPVLDLERDLGAMADRPVAHPDPASLRLTSRHLAYVIYTSGSTGQPKGVMIEHSGLCNYLCWALDCYAPFKEAIVSSSLAFDATITSIYTPLLSGGVARLLPERRDIDGLKEQVVEGREFALVKITPSHLELLGHWIFSQGGSTSVQILVVGGEALSSSTVELWRKIQSKVRLVNEYGPTETVVGCIFYDVPQQFVPSRVVPVGRPISNTRIYILDKHGEPSPIGVAGEIYIGGAGVARGYLNRPELTAERFISSPFVAGDRLYRTGDLGRYLPDGNIEFLGRNDFQVKIRGFRIELGEIEARLAQHPAVREAVVLAREDAPGDKRLAAYYTVRPDVVAPESAALREHVAMSLPDYMVPAAYVRLETLPLTANGKLDREALPAPESDAYAAQPFAPPQGKTEEVLARIFAAALKIERIGRHDNFFELGGDSLLGIGVIFEIEKAFDHELATGILFSNPTVEALAASLDRRGAMPEQISLVPLHTREPGAPIFMVHLIERDLARHLGRRHPVYGLSFGLAAVGAKRDADLPRSIESAASHYIDEMRSVQAHGPYYLIGHSLGGHIAYEMAQQLIKAGETVAFLGLIDSEAPDPALKLRRLPLGRVCLNLLRTPPKDLLDRINGRINKTSLVRRIKIKLLPTQSSFGARLQNVPATPYWPKPYCGRVDLFRATVPTVYLGHEPPPPSEVAWRRLALGGLNVHPLPGGHMHIVKDPTAALTANAIESVIDEMHSDQSNKFAWGNN